MFQGIRGRRDGHRLDVSDAGTSAGKPLGSCRRLNSKSLIDYERQWAEASCTHNGIQKTILAEDFYGTAPDGSRYSKKKELADAQSGVREEACTIYEVTVHFFGDAMAILYGSESAVHVEADGRKHTVKLTWTDTWLKRRGVWQIVAAQDMPSEVK